MIRSTHSHRIGRVAVVLVLLLATISVVDVLASGQAEEPAAGGTTEATEAMEELRDVTVVLDWLPNTNHAGLYLALDRGWFAAEGLNVEVVQPSEVGSDALIAAGRGDFGISHQEAVTFARTADTPLPIVAIAAVLQHNTSGYAAPADRGLEHPGEFAGLDYGGWGTEFEDAMLDAVMAPYDAGAEDVTTVNVGTMDIFVAFQREIDFTWIFYGWDGVRAEVEGVDIDYFPLVELDDRLDYYTPVFIARRALLDEDPAMVRSFLRAVKRGYEAVVDDPAEAAVVLRRYAPEIGAEHAERSLEYLADYFIADAPRWGEMNPDLWHQFTDFLNEQGLLPNPMDVDAAFTNEFLPE